jgi:hypothetical protein
MAKKIEDLRWNCKWVSQLGCMKGCLDYLGVQVSDAWLYGASGHAFILNIHEVVCPSGPTAWNTSGMIEIVQNVGCRVESLLVHKSAGDFEQKKEQAWERTRETIDQGLPCYGWELDIPEFYVVYGYDEDGYYFSGPMHDSGSGPKPWRELGESEIGFIEMFFMDKGPAADDRTLVKQSLEFAIQHSRNPKEWILPQYKSGLGGFESWIDTLDAQTANPMGMAYNSVLWAECRHFAPLFLEEAGKRLNGDMKTLLDEAKEHYTASAKSLEDLSAIFPFPPRGDEIKDGELCAKGVELLSVAKDAESAGLSVLSRIAEALQG